MKKTKIENNRRDFLKKCGLTTASVLLPFGPVKLLASNEVLDGATNKPTKAVNFIFDGLFFSPSEYLDKLQEINKVQTIEPDFYGTGGTTKLLEEEFAKITGKEKAIYLPTGTMANQVAIKLLNENNTKVIVPENSHVFRDEADAAQSVHNKRLIPVGKRKPYFDVEELKNTINYTNENEVFKSGLGTVVLENPIRRADGTVIPIEKIKEISTYCKKHNYKMHLDGARLHIGAAFHSISVSEYASYFDTVYISLYKYLNASGGAILCGDAKIIDQVAHQIKILGGTLYQSWNNTSVSLHYLKDIDKRWEQIISIATTLISELNKIEGLVINSIKNGSNIFNLTLNENIDLKKLAEYLYNEHNIWLGRANEKGIVKFTINESLLTRELPSIIHAWKKGIAQAQI